MKKAGSRLELNPGTSGLSHQCSATEDCEGWWLSSCRGSVAEHWRLKPEVSWVRLPAAASLFHFPLFSPHNIQIHLLFSYCTHNGFVVYTVLMLVLALDSGILVLEQCWSPHLQNTNPKKRKKENGDVNCYTIASVEMSVLFTCSAVQS